MLSDRTNINFPTEKNGKGTQNDLEEQLEVLIEGIRSLTSVVTAPSDYPHGEKRIEQLHSTWRLEDTGFSELFNACKQMKNTLHLTSAEVDNALEELRKTNEIACTAKHEEKKTKKKLIALEKDNLELQKKNSMLMTEVENHKKSKKVIARSIRNFVRIIKEEQSVRSALSIPASNSSNLHRATSMTSYEDEWEEISTSSSGLVTDEGCATIRFAARMAPKKRIYQEKKMKLSNVKVMKKIIRHHNNRNECKKIMRHSNVLELSFPTKCIGIQFNSILRSKDSQKQEEALRVCGFMGFDDTLNRRPAFGSRLVRVDNISLENDPWKMEDLVDYLCAKNGSIQMSFCNELLTTAQIDHLKAGPRGLRI